MGKAYEGAKREVMARINPQMELCAECAAYAEKLIGIEMETRTDPVRNRLGLPYPGPVNG